MVLEMKDKIIKIKSVAQDIDYLRDEYQSIKLWGSKPDGDIEFEKIMQWIMDNDYIVEHMIKVSKDISEI